MARPLLVATCSGSHGDRASALQEGDLLAPGGVVGGTRNSVEVLLTGLDVAAGAEPAPARLRSRLVDVPTALLDREPG